MERDERHLRSFLWIGLRDRWHWAAYRPSPTPSSGCCCRQLPRDTDGSHDPFLPRDDPGGLGFTVHGFPFLALPGLLVVKDFIMLGAAILTMADSAKVYLRERKAKVT